MMTERLCRAANSLRHVGIDLPPDDEMTSLRIEMKIKTFAQRIAYGYKSRTVDVFNDTSRLALWCWEVAAIDQYFSMTEVKRIKEIRAERKKNGSLIKALIRIIMLLQEVGASCNCTLVQTNMLLGFRQCYDQLCGSENSEGEALALG